MSRLMLINTVEGHECRIAISQDGRLEELYTERASSASQVGSIYKGRITNIEPSIQAAFVDFGGLKNGFLHISDVHPKFFPKGKNKEKVGRRTAHRTRPNIQDCLKRGQEIVVQMTKQGIGTKGPTLTTYLSLPGRLVVMMPDMDQVGISRKIEDEEARSKIRGILDELKIPDNTGLIVRTAAIGRSKREFQRDMSYLSRLWKAVQQRIESSRAPAEIYQESDLVIRTIRDVYDSDIERIICDREPVARKVQEFLDLAVPRAKSHIELYTGKGGLFLDFGIEEEIEKIYARRVELPNGGSLVIDQTEALVAIDVNSGSFRANKDSETNALMLNLEAAREIGRQLRLRDLGGVVVMDFVDLRHDRNRRKLEREMRDIMKKDRAKSKILRLSSFGLMEMTRQRLRPSLKQSIYSRCSMCDGTGQIMSQESVALTVMRDLQAACGNNDVARIEVTVSPLVAHQLSNDQRQAIAQMERDHDRRIIVKADEEISRGEARLTCFNSRGAEIAWEPSDARKDSGTPQTLDIRKVPGDKSSPAVGGEEPKAEISAAAVARQAEEDAGDNSQDSQSDQKDEKSGKGQKDEKGGTEEKKSSRSRRGRRRKKKSDSGGDSKDKGPDKQEKGKDQDDSSQKDSSEKSGKSRPSRRRRKKSPNDKNNTGNDAGKSDDAASQQADDGDKNPSDSSKQDGQSEQQDQKPKKKRRRGKRGGRKHRKKSDRKPNPDANEGKDSPDGGKN